jgi:eukaryotic-like serine/threonine-protein kinase
MSPEQCRGDMEVDHRADIYSLGCILFTMLAGRPPFESDSLLELIWLHQNQQPPQLSALVPVTEEVEALVTTMMAKAPAERFASMLAVANAIKGLIHTDSVEMARQPTPAPPVSGMVSTRAALGDSRTTPAFPVSRTPTQTDGLRASRGLVFGAGAALLVAAVGIFFIGRARQQTVAVPDSRPAPAVERASAVNLPPPPAVTPPPAPAAAPAASEALTSEPAGTPVERATTGVPAAAGKRTGRRTRTTAAVDKNDKDKGDKTRPQATTGQPPAPAVEPAARAPGKPIYKGTQLEIEKKVPY